MGSPVGSDVGSAVGVGDAIGDAVGVAVGVGLFSPEDGVGSNATQPQPAKYSSGQVCMSRIETRHPSPVCRPGVNPTATRDGIPAMRAMIAMDAAYCSQ